MKGLPSMVRIDKEAFNCDNYQGRKGYFSLLLVDFISLAKQGFKHLFKHRSKHSPSQSKKERDLLPSIYVHIQLSFHRPYSRFATVTAAQERD
nr:hypothetical protein Q903MT_gene1927 [Picea sitchensis]